MCYCYSQSDEQSTFSNTTTTTTDNTNTNHDSDTDTDSDQKSKPWLSRMFASSKNDTVTGDATATGDFNAAKHFDLKNVRHDFNRPAGIAAAPGVRHAKTGRKIRWEGQQKLVIIYCILDARQLNYSLNLSISVSLLS